MSSISAIITPHTLGVQSKRNIIPPIHFKNNTSKKHTKDKMKWTKERKKAFCRELKRNNIKIRTKVMKRNGIEYLNQGCIDYSLSPFKNNKEWAQHIKNVIIEMEGGINNLPNKSFVNIVQNFWSDRKKVLKADGSSCQDWRNILIACDYFHDAHNNLQVITGYVNNNHTE